MLCSVLEGKILHHISDLLRAIEVNNMHSKMAQLETPPQSLQGKEGLEIYTQPKSSVKTTILLA